MEMRRALVIAVAAVAAVVADRVVAAAAAGKSYVVGAPEGLWDMDPDYAEWVAARTFHPGDNITFTYSRELHDVVEVTKAGYDACSSANNISAFRSGNDVIALAAVSTRYFLCGLTGHCHNGMKIRIDVVDARSSPGPGPATAPSASETVVAAGSTGLLLAVAVAAAVQVLVALR